MDKVSVSDVYAALIQLAIHAETTSWNRFYNFLVGNSILILAWATLYSSTPKSALTFFAMMSIAVLGGVSGPYWAQLGRRSRESLGKYLQIASDLEKDKSCWPVELRKYDVATKVIQIRDSLPNPESGSFALLRKSPWLLSLLYLILIVTTAIAWCQLAHGV